MAEQETFPIECKLSGKKFTLYARPTEASHVYVELARTDDPQQADGAWEIRGITYHGSVHLHLWTDGNWYVGPEYTDHNTTGSRCEVRKTTPYERRQSSVYLKRTDYRSRDYNHEGPSEAALKLILDVIQSHVNAWLKAHPEVLADAHEYHLTKLVATAEQEYMEAEQAFKKAADNLLSARNALAAVRETNKAAR